MVPAGHAVQAAAPGSAANELGAHLLHVSTDVAATPLDDVPFGHGEHCIEEVEEANEPFGHGVHLLARGNE
jgi:hypothetical protein